MNIKYNDLDSSELYTLQNAYKSIQNFLDLLVGSDSMRVPLSHPHSVNTGSIDNTGIHKRHDSISAVLMPTEDSHISSKRLSLPVKTLLFATQNSTSTKQSNIASDQDNDAVHGDGELPHNGVASSIVHDLVVAQDRLKRLSVRLEILESLQVSVLL